jgi:alpha-tubulin suppressor-like RCC1 family protein
MKKTRLSSVASLLATGVLMGGCMADVGGESESEGVAAQGPNVSEAKQALPAEQEPIEWPKQEPLAGLWTAWQKLDLPVNVYMEKSPAISSRGNGKFDVFVLGTDNNIYMQSYAPAFGFGPWANLGGAPGGLTFVSGPDAVSSDANSFAVVAMASNGHYFLNTWPQASGTMSGWKQILGRSHPQSPGPGISSRGPGLLDIYGFGPDSQTWESRQAPQEEWGWTWPKPLGSPQNAPLASNVTSVSWDSNKVDLFVRGSDNSLWTRGWDATGWKPQDQNWQNLGGQFASGFGAASWGSEHLDVFGVGTDSKLYQIQYHARFAAEWSSFKQVEAPPVGLAAGSSPDAVSSGPGRIHLIVRGSDNQPWVRSFIAFTVGDIRRRPAVAASDDSSMVIKSDGTVAAWGDNWYGQLGDGTTVNHLWPGQVSILTDVAAMAAIRGESVLAINADGTVWGWGANGSGQLGVQTRGNLSTPEKVLNLTDVVAVATGDFHSLALKRDGTVWAFGHNGSGQLGDPTIASLRPPTQVSNLTGVVAVAAGFHHSLAVKANGTVWAFGHNQLGQLGDGTNTPSNTPVQVSNLTGVVAVAAGFHHSLALKNDGTVWAWGSGMDGQLGYEQGPTSRNTPAQVPGLTDVVAVAAGDRHSLALKADGTVWGWGNNLSGQLGNGTWQPYHYTPVKALNLTDVEAVTAGDSHSMAVKRDGTVWTWGYNLSGQLGSGTDGTTLMYRNTPEQVMGLSAKL